MAVFTGMDLDATLSNLRRELYHDYLHKGKTQERLQKKNADQHQRMVGIVKKCNDLSLMLLFSATWFYDLIREVLIPLMMLFSIPVFLYWALDIFEFKDLYRTIFEEPFLRQGEFRVSLYSIIFLGGMFVVFRYANKAIHTV